MDIVVLEVDAAVGQVCGQMAREVVGKSGREEGQKEKVIPGKKAN